MNLTDKKYWNSQWSKINVPIEIEKGTNSFTDEILEIFDKFLPNKNLKILEIGGAPGQYLAYMKKNFNCEIFSLDYTEIGCLKTQENFDLLGISGVVYKRNLFSDLSDLPKFDVVYSLGFIEHFKNLDEVIEKHLDLLKPNGILIIGAPNFLGLNKLILEKLNLEDLSKHELSTMDIKNWKHFEKKFDLEIMFKGYIGGFEHFYNLILLFCIHIFKNKENLERSESLQSKEKKSAPNAGTYKFFKIFSDRIKIVIKGFKKINSKHYSRYVIGVYKK